jgi:uncharacterized membrane protein YccC
VNRSALLSAVLHSVILAIACLISFLLTTRVLAPVHALSKADDYLGGMWSVISTIFVYRVGYHESHAAALSRTVATLLSFVLCLVYLLLFPFSPLGLAVVIGVGTLVLWLTGRAGEVVTTGITSTVVLVVAALSPQRAWEQPILRLVDTAVGIAVGIAAAWITARLALLYAPSPPGRQR